LIGGLLVTALKKIAELYPKYEERFLSIYESFAKLFKFQFNEESSLFENLWSHLQVREFVKNLAVSLSQGVIQFFKNFLIICLYTVFFLLEMRIFRVKFINAFDKSSKGRIGNIISGIITEVSQYMSIKFYISLATGVLVWFGCMTIGIDFAIIWGFLAFVANFIPTFGSIVSCFVTILFSVLQFWPHPARIIATGIFMISVNMIIGNIVEPRIQGRELDLSPFIILVSLTLWGYIWGFIGMIVAVPLMVIIKIICENISSLKPVAILLGNDTD
jgi:predicted PurR-regulated permease PerM